MDKEALVRALRKFEHQNEFFLTAQLHTRIDRLADRSEYFFILAVGLPHLLFPLKQHIKHGKRVKRCLKHHHFFGQLVSP